MDTEQGYIVGEIKAIFFENASNFYKVMLISVNESNLPKKQDEIVVTGSFGQITEDTVSNSKPLPISRKNPPPRTA